MIARYVYILCSCGIIPVLCYILLNYLFSCTLKDYSGHGEVSYHVDSIMQQC